MDLGDLIDPDHIISAHGARSKKQLLEDLSDIASEKTGIPARKIFDTLLQRERLGSTGVGNGIAIPHGKLANLSEITGILVKLETPVEFDAPDNIQVDVVFLLLAPEDAGADHLKALARVARVMRDTDMMQKLRQANDKNTIHALLTELPASNAA